MIQIAEERLTSCGLVGNGRDACKCSVISIKINCWWVLLVETSLLVLYCSKVCLLSENYECLPSINSSLM